MRAQRFDRDSDKIPGVAAALSVVPGLGQLYNGETRKAILFLDAAVANFLLLWLILFTGPLTEALARLGWAFHVQINGPLLAALGQARLGSPLSFIILGLITSFAAYAARDAYDTCLRVKRRSIYPEFFLELPEATSGAYLLHLAVIGCCCILACFFIIPPQPKVQVTDIEFLEETHRPQIEKPKHFVADHPHSTGVHNPSRPVSVNEPAASQPALSRPLPKPAAAHSADAGPPVPAPRPAPPVPSPTPPAVTHQVAPAPPVIARQPGPAPPVMPVQPKNSVPFPGRTAVPTPAVPTAEAQSAPAPKLLSAQPRGLAPLPAPPKHTSQEMAFSPAPPMMPASSQGSNAAAAPVPVPSAATAQARAGNPALAPAPSRLSGSRDAASGGPSLAVLPARPGQAQPGNPPSTRPGPAQAGGVPVDYSLYMANLQRRIKHEWFPPRATETQRVVVIFKIGKNGDLLALKLDKPSGSALCDQAAIKAVQTAAPFAPLPAGSDETIDVQFTFDYNLFGGGSHGSLRNF